MREYFRALGLGLVAIAAIVVIVAGPATAETLPVPVIHLKLDGNLDNTGSSSVIATIAAATDGHSTSTYETGLFGQGLRLDNYVLPATGETTTSGGTYVSIPYTLPDEGTISFWFKTNMAPFTHMSLVDNSVGANDWEMWYNDGDAAKGGQVAWRVDLSYTNHVGNAEAGTDIGFDGEFHFYTGTWKRSTTDNTKVDFWLYVDGVAATGGVASERLNDRWLNPGDTVYFGGGGGNQHSVGTYDDFRIHNVALTAGQVATLYSIPEPGSLMLLVSALLAFGIRGRKAA